MKTIKKCVKYVSNEQQKHQNDVNDIVLVFLLLTLNVFHTLVFLSFFEQANISW